MIINRYVLSFVIAILLATGAYCQTPESYRIEKLEKKVESLSKALEEARERTPEINEASDKDESQGTAITDRVSLSGLLEVEGAMSFEDMLNGDKTKSSDIALATVELAIEADVAEKVTASLILLWEEDSPGTGMEKFDVDEGVIIYEGDTFQLTAGRFYMPFGMFYSSFISDPLTLELGETQESGVAFQFQPTDISDLILSLANGNVSDSVNGSNVTDFGVAMFFHPIQTDEYHLDLGVQYYSDMADTDAEILGGTAPSDTVGAMAFNMEYTTPRWTFNFELVAAESKFPVAFDNNMDGNGDQPAAWNFEASMPVSEKVSVAFKYEKSDEFMDFPKTRIGVAGSWELDNNVLFDLEYLYDTYDRNFSSSGLNNAHTVTTKLSAGF